MRQITDVEMKEMLITYMEKGFLENIIDMFRDDPSLVRFIPDMIRADNLKIRIGVVALVQELSQALSKELEQIIPSLVELLKDRNPVLRGDIAYMLSLIKSPSSLLVLKSLCCDENPDVREIALEAFNQTDISH
ncbi:MAG: HEAT repeat domain-containing protein [bacterium]